MRVSATYYCTPYIRNTKYVCKDWQRFSDRARVLPLFLSLALHGTYLVLTWSRRLRDGLLVRLILIASSSCFRGVFRSLAMCQQTIQSPNIRRNTLSLNLSLILSSPFLFFTPSASSSTTAAAAAAALAFRPLPSGWTPKFSTHPFGKLINLGRSATDTSYVI